MNAAVISRPGAPGFVPEWHDRALCAQMDPEEFFPDKGGSTRQAKRVCMSCEVRAECLDYALAAGEEHGIWGGLSVQERRAVARLGVPRVALAVTPEPEPESPDGATGAATS